MRNTLFYLILVSLFAGCTAANTPNSGGISIPNLVAAPNNPSANSGADYVFVESWDIDGGGNFEKLLFSAGRNRGSIRKAKTGELLVTLDGTVTRFALIDAPGTSAHDIVLLNNQAGADDRGLTVIDGRKLYNDHAIVAREHGFNGPVFALVPYGSHFLLATGDAVVETDADFVEVQRYAIAAKDAAMVKIKNNNYQLAFHTEKVCGELPYCVELHRTDFSAIDYSYSTNAVPGRYLSMLPDDYGEDGSVERLFVANGNRTREIKYSGSFSAVEQHLTGAAGTAETAMASLSLAARTFWNRTGYRDLLVTAEVAGKPSTTLYKQDSSGGGAVANTYSAAFTWDFPKLRGGISRQIYAADGDDIILMESHRIHVLQCVRESNGDIHFDAKYEIAD